MSGLLRAAPLPCTAARCSRRCLSGSAAAGLAAALLSFTAARGAVIVGPWLAGDTTTNVTVLVECDSAAPLTVNYGPTTAYGLSASTSECWTNPQTGGDFIHRIPLPGLQSNLVYHYQVTGQDAAAADYNFITRPLPNLVTGLTLAKVPPAVSNALAAAAGGRAVEKINRANHVDGPQYYAYLADALGPQLLTVNAAGDVLINARVVPFAGLPPAIQTAARAAVAGRLQVCRQARQTSAPFVVADAQRPYVIDFILGEDESVFVLLRETDGWVRAVHGYFEEDPD